MSETVSVGKLELNMYYRLKLGTHVIKLKAFECGFFNIHHIKKLFDIKDVECDFRIGFRIGLQIFDFWFFDFQNYTKKLNLTPRNPNYY